MQLGMTPALLHVSIVPQPRGPDVTPSPLILRQHHRPSSNHCQFYTTSLAVPCTAASIGVLLTGMPQSRRSSARCISGAGICGQNLGSIVEATHSW